MTTGDATAKTSEAVAESGTSSESQTENTETTEETPKTEEIISEEAIPKAMGEEIGVSASSETEQPLLNDIEDEAAVAGFRVWRSIFV